tara:strand:+ start:33 stop:1151 length:1119 start_codon:yes stop_codon:yes gene_type:complete
MKSKLDLVSQDIHFPWFDPTVHSWFKNKWDEPESEDSKSLGIDIKNEFDKLYEHKHSVYNLLDTSPYTNLMPLLQRLYNQGVPENMVNRLYKEIHTELCTTATISQYSILSSNSPKWYDDFYENGCIQLKIKEEDVSLVLRHIVLDIEELIKQGNVWHGVGYDNEHRYVRNVDRELYKELDSIFLKYGILDAAKEYFNYSMVVEGVTLHVCKQKDQHWQMTMADQTPTPYENLHFDPKNGMLKCIFYLNEVTNDNGPFSYIEGSHKWNDDPFNRVIAKSVSVSNYLENDEKRNQFLKLPRTMQKCANIGAFLQDNVNDMFTKEKKYTSDQGNIMFFDPGGLHRGGIVHDKGMRANLQIMFRLAHNGQTVPFI